MAKKAGKAKAGKKSAKKAGKKAAKARVRKKAAPRKKKAAKKTAGPTRAKKVAKKAAAPPFDADVVTTTAVHTLAPVLTRASQAAVTGCVKKYMDHEHRGWNADLRGETRRLVADYHETPQTIPLILDCVRTCLERSGYTFMTTPDLVQTCVTGTVGDMEYAIYENTTRS